MEIQNQKTWAMITAIYPKAVLDFEWDDGVIDFWESRVAWDNMDESRLHEMLPDGKLVLEF